MHNKNNDLLIEYTSPRIGDWMNLRQLVADNFPEISKKTISHIIRNGMSNMIVARQGQQLLGFCYFENFSKNKLHLLYLATDSNYYRQGIASHILKYIDCHAIDRGCSSVVLTLDNDNQAAKKLYEKMGYCLTKVRKEENKESWKKILNGEILEHPIKYGFWQKNYYLLRVCKKIIYRYLIK